MSKAKVILIKLNPINHLVGIFWFALAAVVIFFLLFNGLVDNLQNMSQPEIDSVSRLINSERSGLSMLSTETLNLPHNLGLELVSWLGGSSIYAARFVSAVFGVVSIIATYFVIKRWYTARIAYLGSMIYASSVWFLHTARLASPDSQYLLLPVLCLLAIILHDTAKISRVSLAISFFVIGFLLYIPGVVWFVVGAGVWQRKKIKHVVANLKGGVWVASLCILILTPLFSNVLHNPGVLIDWIGFSGFVSPSQSLTEILKTPLRVFIVNDLGPVYTVGSLPYLTLFSGALLVLGIRGSVIARVLDREKSTLATIILLWVLIALGTVPIVALAPYVYILVAGGLVVLIGKWFAVFPKNPFARYLGIVLLFSLIVLNINFNYQRYFNAWQKSPETQDAFNINPVAK